ncbi:helix-turn-helix domain-containing protein [Microbacterium sp. CFBP 13617]|uniref:helix-turn-helix transcriptional regulator n=1 Tax=Microbacterium sp. CFBP 13617 TaxID=2774035 RepID=UPI001787713D|nr:helix-turn-helix transcriptional regulator [Microbacterium sp. CFBP 13617]MBD8217441.1 helix-turn-helix domain-containing protein [Microbacterium sp. CFBP 13617]
MDNRAEVREFLTSRRAKLTPDDVGISGGSNRRVPGLRRNEVATLAGVSIEYYSKIERGQISGASESVLHAIAQALQLDDAEREHLFDLARAAGQTPPRSRRKPGTPASIRSGMELMLDAITGGAAMVRNGRMDILAVNALGRALQTEVFESPGDGNLARYTFLDPRAHDFHPNWEKAADITVGILRTEAGRDPYDRDLQDLVGELSTRSDEFRVRWGAHDVRQHGAGKKQFTHPIVGALELSYEDMQFVQHPGLTFLVYVPQTGSESEERFRLLASWQATNDAAPSTRPRHSPTAASERLSPASAKRTGKPTTPSRHHD